MLVETTSQVQIIQCKDGGYTENAIVGPKSFIYSNLEIISKCLKCVQSSKKKCLWASLNYILCLL